MNGKDASAVVPSCERCHADLLTTTGYLRCDEGLHDLPDAPDPALAGASRGRPAPACKPHAAPPAPSRAERGQSTVEYALVIVAFLSMAIALAAVWHAGRSGGLLDQAVDASSHQLGGGDALGSWRDISLF